MNHIRVASRKSALALTQTNWVIEQLTQLDGSISFEIVPIVTKGDKILDIALSKVGGKGLFVSEVEQALLDGAADLAVHSMKDVPAELATGLILSGIPEREDARDALISRDGILFRDLAEGATIGTSSLRRVAQIRAIRPDLNILPLRGNIDTRLRKLDAGEFDAIILAAAGLHRMGWANRITEYLHPSISLPAIGQGVLGIECRSGDVAICNLLEQFTHMATKRCAIAERTLLQRMNGSCQVPIAGYAVESESGRLQLHGLVATTDGTTVVSAHAEDTDPVRLGEMVAMILRDRGADEILRHPDGA